MFYNMSNYKFSFVYLEISEFFQKLPWLRQCGYKEPILVVKNRLLFHYKEFLANRKQNEENSSQKNIKCWAKRTEFLIVEEKAVFDY